jgi:hypothetical protein
MATLAEIRQQYPQYQDMSDDALASAFHSKFYSDMPREEFDKKIGLSKAKPVSTLADVAKSAGTGLIKGAAGVGGLVGDLQSLVGAGMDKILGPKSPEAQAAIGGGLLPTSGGIQSKIEGVTGPLYKPQTTAGQYAQTAGEFAPGLALGGGGGAATRLGRNWLAPAVTSETAGQLTKDTALEPYARIAGALAPAAAPRLASDVIGTLGTGTGGQSVRTAFQSGAAGGSAGRAFRDNMRGNVPLDDVVTEAKSAVRGMRADRGAQYETGMQGIRADQTVLSFNDIDQAVARANNVKQFKGQELSKSTADVRKQIQDQIDEWKALNPTEYHTPAGIDALKQAIGDIKDSLPFNTPQRAVADQVYNAIRQTIVKQAPDYANVMKGYEQASTHIGEIEKTLSLGRKASTDTALRKLQSVTRNNVNTNYGKRVDLVEALAGHGAPDIMEKLAGQAMNTWAPRGLNKITASMAGAASYLNPMALAALPLMSPRIVGEAAHGVGRVAGALSRGGQSTPTDPRLSALVAALLAQSSGGRPVQ